MTKILIGDDHAIVRKGLKQILSDTRDIVVADEAGSGQEVLDKVMKRNFDVVVLDISMPGKGGLEVLSHLKHQKPDLPVLILSMYPEEQYAMQAFRAGARGYVTKQSAPEELISAIRKLSQGGRYISSSFVERFAHQLGDNKESPIHEGLSDREYQVMCMIAQGRTVSEIGDEMCLSVKTISTYRSRILGKMKMRTNAQLTHYAIKNSLV